MVRESDGLVHNDIRGYYKDTENIGNASYAFWEEQNKKLCAY